MSDTAPEKKQQRTSFPKLFWLVVLFEFFERGSYYGMMSVLSVYMTDVLGFAKQDVGVIKATIQPLLYFLPIISGALADRFGYRRTLMVAFSLLGSGYFLTSQATEYLWVFLALVVMGLGAGTFKPVISGTIARCTDETNSTLGFGIFYWSINLGAFLFPLVLVPYLKNNVGWTWVIIAAAIGTGTLLLPTALFFREPPATADPGDAKKKPSLLQTLANAFEIIYSPFVLLHHLLRQRAAVGGLLLFALAAVLFGYGGWRLLQAPESIYAFSARAYDRGGAPRLVVRVARNLGKQQPFTLVERKGAVEAGRSDVVLALHDPDRMEQHAGAVVAALRGAGIHWVSREDLRRFVAAAARKTSLRLGFDDALSKPFQIAEESAGRFRLTVREALSATGGIVAEMQRWPELAGLGADELAEQIAKAGQRPFFLPFVGLLLVAGLLALRLSARFRERSTGGKLVLLVAVVGGTAALLWILWGVGYLSLFAAILCTVITATAAALFAIDHDDVALFGDHFRFLMMIFLYSGFWVLYFQMFDSVLWYVQAYVDASSLDAAVNGFLAAVGLGAINFRFDVEHVTVINAGTIILLQLLVSTIVKNTRALPTMVAGIGLGTIGMAILAVSTGIWIFMLGIIIFSVGEMTAHPKFISYVGQTAPRARVATYMGYIFLYGVIGSSIGSMIGANLYVRYVDQLNQPRTLWLIFAGIGVATIIGLLIYNAVWGRKEASAATEAIS